MGGVIGSGLRTRNYTNRRMAWVKVLNRLVAVRQLLDKLVTYLSTVISERDYVPKCQDDSLAGQPIARDGLSMGCPAMPFGSRVRELERKFMSA